jgi:hypothetical protein
VFINQNRVPAGLRAFSGVFVLIALRPRTNSLFYPSLPPHPERSEN